MDNDHERFFDPTLRDYAPSGPEADYTNKQKTSFPLPYPACQFVLSPSPGHPRASRHTTEKRQRPPQTDHSGFTDFHIHILAASSAASTRRADPTVGETLRQVPQRS